VHISQETQQTSHIFPTQLELEGTGEYWKGQSSRPLYRPPPTTPWWVTISTHIHLTVSYGFLPCAFLVEYSFGMKHLLPILLLVFSVGVGADKSADEKSIL
jgi:hypothetical protein